jgi:hypothetical protein
MKHGSLWAVRFLVGGTPLSGCEEVNVLYPNAIFALRFGMAIRGEGAFLVIEKPGDGSRIVII